MSETPDEVSNCPECGSNKFDRLPEGDPDDYACAECGYIIGSKTDLSEISTPSERNLTNDEQNAERTKQASKHTEWSKWYPCPVCGSTTFEQTETLTVYGSDDGMYNGDDADLTESIKCSECGSNLRSP